VLGGFRRQRSALSSTIMSRVFQCRSQTTPQLWVCLHGAYDAIGNPPIALDRVTEAGGQRRELRRIRCG